MKIKLNKNNEWEELPKGSKEGVYIDGKLYQIILNIFFIIAKSWDCVIVIDGKEGSGKSTLALLLGYILTKGKLSINNIAEGATDAIQKLENIKDLLILDEGSLLFASKDAMRKEYRKMEKILNVIRQKGMVLIIVAPSFFDLNKYVSVSRSRFLLHVYTDRKLNRGFFAYFGEKRKKLLYVIGKKNFNSYAKPRSNFTGRFTKFEPEWYADYLKTKERTLQQAFHEDDKPMTEASMMKNCWKKVVSRLDICDPPLMQKQKAQIIEMSKKSIERYSKELKAMGQETNI